MHVSHAYKYCATRGKNRRENIDSATCIPLLGANDWRTTRFASCFCRATFYALSAKANERIGHLDDDDNEGGIRNSENGDARRWSDSSNDPATF